MISLRKPSKSKLKLQECKHHQMTAVKYISADAFEDSNASIVIDKGSGS